MADVLHGRKLMTISSENPIATEKGSTPNYYGPTPNEYGPIPVLDNIHHATKEVSAMPVSRVSVFNFSEFCEARPDRQESVVLKIRKRTLDPKKGFDYYGPLKHLIRRTHWATNDLATFESALDPFLNGQKKVTMADNYRCMADAYIDYWDGRANAYFPVLVTTPDVVIEGLTIRATPELGMLTKDGDRQILKLWFNRVSPTRQARLIVGHLMGKVNPNSQWHIGIWDIKQRNIPLPVLAPDGFDLVLAGQAAAFLRIWEGLDQEAQQGLE